MAWFSKWAKSPPLPPEQVVDEFLAFIRERSPDLQLSLDGEALKITGGKGSGSDDDSGGVADQTMMLGKLLHETSDIAGDKPDQRREVYQKWWGVASSSHQGIEEAYTAGFEAVRERIFPKVVQPGFLEHVREMGVEPSDVPHLLLGSTPFPIVFVLDFPSSVAYIMPQQFKELQVDFDALRAVAWENAARLFPRHEARAMIEGGQVIAMFCAEGHNSARAVLLPEYLEPGEEVALLIPDRDQIMLLPAPPDNNWNSLRQMLTDPYGLPQPLLVRAGDVTAM